MKISSHTCHSYPDSIPHNQKIHIKLLETRLLIFFQNIIAEEIQESFQCYSVIADERKNNGGVHQLSVCETIHLMELSKPF